MSISMYWVMFSYKMSAQLQYKVSKKAESS